MPSKMTRQQALRFARENPVLMRTPGNVHARDARETLARTNPKPKPVEVCEMKQLQEDAAELARVIIDLLDRGVVSGVHERDRLGTLPALRRCAQSGDDQAEKDKVTP